MKFTIKEILMLGCLLIFLESGFGYMLYLTIPLINGNITYINFACMLSMGIGFFMAYATLFFMTNKNNELKIEDDKK